jgi:glycosyltransferase involved in cell wall biosynthesis
MLNSKVSVIIPVYNSEKFLKESIESAIHQTYSDIEIIAINDGSTDGSLEILKQFKDKITIINQKNTGLAEAVNAGIKKMSGNWLKWLSPDDVLYPNAVEILVEEAKKLPEITIIYSNWEMIDENGKKIRNFYESNYNEFDNFGFNVRLLDGQLINVNTVLISKSIFKKGCIMQTLNDTSSVDYNFFLRAGILYWADFHLVEKNLLKYRIHENQTSHRNITKSLKYLEQIKKEILSNLDEKTRKSYHITLKKYSQEKKISKKVMKFGLNIITNFFPTSLSDLILVFYINKIRNRR